MNKTELLTASELNILDQLKVKSESPALYSATKESDNDIIEHAKTIIFNRLKVAGAALTSPKETIDYLILELSNLEYEIFGCLYLDNRHRVIAFEKLSTGTIDGCNVYPREVVKSALKHNAAAIILTHNHPSGMPEPSNADERITKRLVTALNTVDIRTLDHIIIGGLNSVSFAERGLI